MLTKLIHGNINLYSEISEETRKAALQQLLKIKSDLKQHKSAIIKEELSLIKQINSVSQKTLELVKFQENKLSEIIIKIQNLKWINNSEEATFIKSILKLPSTDLSKIQLIQCPSLQITTIDPKNIQKLFKLDKLSEENFLLDMNYENDKNLFKYVKNGDNILRIFNVETKNFLKKTLPIDIQFGRFGSVCFLPDGSIFNYTLKSPIIICPDYSIKYLPKWEKKSRNSCSIYKDEYIYLFGETLNTSAKFSLSKNRWIPIIGFLIDFEAYYPSPFIFKHYIILGATKSKSIFYYDTIIDSYSKISFSNIKWSPRIFFVVNESLYFTNVSIIKLGMTENLVTWKELKDRSSFDLSDTYFICSPIIYNQKLYYLSYKSIIAFDLKSKKAVEVSKIPMNMN